ncbi:hypothetical protein [Paenibacillus sp. MMO-177]|uniref:hypothetical protein n=1 Tax=Paenibacillus sp. MMO-177 TaxID=3081289 RepID=UPI00301B3A99
MSKRMISSVASGVTALLIIVIICAWSPWISKAYASDRTINQFKTEWKDTADGCGFNCEGCGVRSSERKLFGWKVTINYACGQLAENQKPIIKTKTYYVSFIGTE